MHTGMCARDTIVYIALRKYFKGMHAIIAIFGDTAVLNKSQVDFVHSAV